MPFNFKHLEDMLGSRITTDDFECSMYSTDLAPLPSMINLLFSTKPDAVVRPKNPHEISEIMKFANKNKIPVTPRASATSALGNVIPTRAGIVMDLSSMDNKIEINIEDKTVNVSAGVVWHNLEKVLNREGFALMTYPSSAPFATVGGWLSSQGYGIGTMKFGRVYDQVLDMEIVLPEGRIKYYSGEGRYKFLGMEGTTGIITEVELKIRDIPEIESPHVLIFDSQEKFLSAIPELISLNPYNISYASRSYAELMEKVKGGGSSKKHDFEFTALVVFEGNKNKIEYVIKNLDKIKKAGGIKEEPAAVAEAEWNDRFNPMRIKRTGPTLLAGDLLIPIGQMGTVINRLNNLHLPDMCIEGTIVSEDKAVVMPMYLTDERKFLDFIFALRHLKKMNDIAVSSGGIPYGTGIWNSPYIGDILTKKELKKKTEFKKKVDRNNIMNPDKYFGVKLAIPSSIFNPNIYGLSMFSAGIASKPLRLMGVIK